MKAIVLVGGFGTRLRPLTYDVPKPLLPIGNRPMVEHMVSWLGSHGIKEVILSLAFRPQAFVEAFPDGTCAGVALVCASEPEPLDTAGAIGFAAREAGIDDTFVVLNGDVLTNLDLGRLIAVHRRCGAEGTLHLTPVEDPSAFGVVVVDGAGRVERFVEKPPRAEAPANTINAGTYVLEPSMLARIAPDRRVSIEREVFPAMVADRTLYALATDDYWIDTGKPDTYLQANLDVLEGRYGAGAGAAVVATSTEVDETAMVSRSVLGAGVRVEPGAHVHESVVFAGAVVESGASVVRSLIGERAVVGAGASLSGLCVIGNDARVDAGAHLEGVRIPEPG